MNDWVVIILASVAGYFMIAGMLEYQRQNVSGQIDSYFAKDEDRKSFFTVISETHSPSDFWIQIIAGGSILAIFGKIVLQQIWIRVLLYAAPIIFFNQIVLLEYSIQSFEIMIATYLFSFVLAFVFCKYQDMFVGICTGVVSSYFMFYLMTQDYHRQRQKPGITCLIPMYIAGTLFSVAIAIYAHGNLNSREMAMFKRYTLFQLLTYYLACLWLGYYNIHLTIAAHKIQNHQYENHIEHGAIYYGLILTFMVGGGYLINLLFWIQGNRFKPFFLTAAPEEKTIPVQ